MTTRRKFIAGAAAMVIGSTAYGQKEKKGNNPLVHHVFFWLKNPESKEDLAKLIEGVNSLKKIKSLKLVKIGVPALTEKRDVIDNSYNLSLFHLYYPLMVMFPFLKVNKKYIEYHQYHQMK